MEKGRKTSGTYFPPQLATYNSWFNNKRHLIKLYYGESVAWCRCQAGSVANTYSSHTCCYEKPANISVQLALHVLSFSVLRSSN